MKIKLIQNLYSIIPAFLCSVILFESCSSNFSNEENQTEEDTIISQAPVQEALPTVGPFYADTVHCKGCNDVFAQISFQSDSGFTMMEQVLPKTSIPMGFFGRWRQVGDTVMLFAEDSRKWIFKIVPRGLMIVSYDNIYLPEKDKQVMPEEEGGSFNTRDPFNVTGYYSKIDGQGVWNFCHRAKTLPVRPMLSAKDADRLFNDRNNSDNKPVMINADITFENVLTKDGIYEDQVVIYRIRQVLGYGNCE